jgi:hypothetical protein
MSDHSPHRNEPEKPAVAASVERPVRPLAARLSVLQVLLAESHPEHHATVAEAVQQLERWETYRAEMAGSERRIGRIAGNFLSLQAWEDAAKCAMRAEGMKWVQGRMPPAA